MTLFDFVVTVIMVTASGALAPGPLFFGTLVHGTKEGARSGFSCALGHTVVEFPLVLALALGLLVATNQPLVKSVIGIAGGLGLIIFGALQICETFKAVNSRKTTRTGLPASSFILGLALTGLNPYFIIWWLTIGSILIVQALTFAAILGVLLMYVAHVWMDYAFLTGIAYLAKRGRNIVGSKYYKLVLTSFGIILIYYGATFLISAISL